MILDLERYKLNCCGSICNVYMCMFISSACGYTACRVGALPPVRRVAWWADKGSLHCMAKQVSARCIRMFHSGRRHGFLRKSAGVTSSRPGAGYGQLRLGELRQSINSPLSVGFHLSTPGTADLARILSSNSRGYWRTLSW
jgi:hypothetical protein